MTLRVIRSSMRSRSSNGNTAETVELKRLRGGDKLGPPWLHNNNNYRNMPYPAFRKLKGHSGNFSAVCSLHGGLIWPPRNGELRKLDPKVDIIYRLFGSSSWGPYKAPMKRTHLIPKNFRSDPLRCGMFL